MSEYDANGNLVTTSPRRFHTIAEISDHAVRKGSHFFDRDAKRFFRSQIRGKVYHDYLFGQDAPEKRNIFITSEQFVDSRGKAWAREYTVRQYHPETGNVESLSEFGQFRSRDAAKGAIHGYIIFNRPIKPQSQQEAS